MSAAPPTGLFTITIGERSPFAPLPADQLTAAMSLAQPRPVIIVSLPEVTDSDIANVKAPLHAVALRRSTALPSGTLLLLLSVSTTEVWSIAAPFLDDASTMAAWANSQMNSTEALVVLVDAGSQIIRAQRTISLPPRLLDMAQQGILQSPCFDELVAIEELLTLSDREIWEQSTRWQDVDDSGVFTMVAEAPVQK